MIFCGVRSICENNIFMLYLNLKPDDRFLPYNMAELFNKTIHDLTDIVIA